MTDETAIDDLLAPIRSAIESEYARRELFGSIGWDVDAFPEARIVDALETIDDAATELIGFTDDPPESLPEFGEALQAASDLADGFITLDDAVGDTTEVPPDIYAALGEDLFTRIVVRYINSNHPVLFQVAVFLTLVRPVDPTMRPALTLDDGTIVRYPSAALDFDFKHVVDLLTDPVETLKAEYGLDEPADAEEFQRKLAQGLFPLVTALLSSTGGRVSYSTENLGFYDPFESFGAELGWIRVDYDLGPTNFNVRVHIYSDDGDVTLVVVPGGDAVVTHRLGQWAFTLALDSTAEEVAIDADSVQFPDTTSRVGVNLRALKIPSTPSGDSFVVGGTEGTRLEIGRLGVEGYADIESEQEYGIVARASDSTFALDTSDGDDFLSEVFPEGLRADFDLGLGWSTRHGVHLEGSQSLERTRPMHLSLGRLISLDELTVSVSPDSDTARIPVYVASSVTAQLGPITATVKRVGLEVDFTPTEEGGNLGPVDVDVGFKSPTGVGLSIDTDTVVGGGYLYFDEEHQRYAGTLTLKVGTLTLNAVGLLTTRLPGGRDGFSLLVVIAGEFPPVRLGLGFTLNGVGGLLGVNRTVHSAALQDAVRQGSLDSILFPEDPVANATRIVSDLGQVFPPKRDQHVFGPMVKIAWGTPPLVTADLGFIVEFPSSVVTLLGRVNATLPEAGVDPLIDLNVGIAGQILPDEQRAVFDASLYDSRVGTWTATGDAALRSRWGEKPWFLLAVGGVHPRYDPPTDIPDLDRIAISGTPPTGFPRVEIEGYIALTSNTAQTGADVWVRAEAGPATVEGEIGFDALFRFDPFEFVVDFAAAVAVEVSGKGLSITLDGTLSGPAPWRVNGTIHVDLFFFDVTASVDVSVGAERAREPLPSTRVMPKLVSAFENPGNWTAQQPAGGQSVVSLRDVEADGQVSAHPLGRLGVRQTVVPLDFELDKVGNTRPGDFTRFTVNEIAIEGHDGDGTSIAFDQMVREHFAPAQYEDLTETQKLTRPAFQRLPAGREVEADRVFYGGETAGDLATNTRTTTLTYETSVIDERKGVHAMELAELGSFTSKAEATVSIPQATADALSAVSAVARADTRTTGSARFRPPDQPPGRTGPDGSGLLDADRPTTRDGTYLTGPVSMGEANYVVVRATDLAPTSIGATDERPTVMGRAEAEQALDRHLASHPKDEGDLRVVEASAVREMGRAGSDDEPDHSLTAGELLQ